MLLNYKAVIRLIYIFIFHRHDSNRGPLVMMQDTYELAFWAALSESSPVKLKVVVYFSPRHILNYILNWRRQTPTQPQPANTNLYLGPNTLSLKISRITSELPGPRLNIKTVFPGMVISIVKIRRSWDRLIFIMGIFFISVRRHLYIVTDSRGPFTNSCIVTPIRLKISFVSYPERWLWHIQIFLRYHSQLGK